jgi:hypothetical protein
MEENEAFVKAGDRRWANAAVAGTTWPRGCASYLFTLI